MSVKEPTWEPSLAFTQAMGESVPPPPRVTPADAFTAARDHFRAGDRLDMVALASELGVARATLYRWTGGRDQLLADLICAELALVGAHVQQAATGTGEARLEQIIGRFVEILAAAPAMRTLLANEGDSGLRLVIAPNGPVRPRIVTMLADVIEAERAAGTYHPPASPEVLADGIVSLGERYMHNGGDPSLNPDPASLRVIVGLLLRESA